MEIYSICKVKNVDEYKQTKVGDEVIVVNVLDKDSKLAFGRQNVLAVKGNELNVKPTKDKKDIYFYEEDLVFTGKYCESEEMKKYVDTMKETVEMAEEVAIVVSDTLGQLEWDFDKDPIDKEQDVFTVGKVYKAKQPGEFNIVRKGDKIVYQGITEVGYPYIHAFSIEGNVNLMEYTDFLRKEDVVVM